MPSLFQQALKQLSQPEPLALLKGIQRGIEKESLRVDVHGHLAQTPHPAAFGSALTHPSITTDFSEALLEFITPVATCIDTTLRQLEHIHRFVVQQLHNEMLWSTSMPCVIGSDDSIPIAHYGSANIAHMKTIYRRGLSARYGRSMQAIAGIHYNFSLPQALWHYLPTNGADQHSIQDTITAGYFHLIRNFRRYVWLLIYLYGASPALDNSFLQGRAALENLQEHDLHSAYMPYATALRMSDLGYQSKAQQAIAVSYNNLDDYIDSLCTAIVQQHRPYQAMGVKLDGHYRQLSTGLLQIENEFYSPVRPKRVAASGEIPLAALRRGGVEYVEVRCIDLNPYLPLGIDGEQIRFLDSFLLYCLLADSPLCDHAEQRRVADNIEQMVYYGRQPNVQLHTAEGMVAASSWAQQLLDDVAIVADLLDRAHGGDNYRQACERQRAKVQCPALTPSARLLSDMHGRSFFEVALQLSREHNDYFHRQPLAAEDWQQLVQQSRRSIEQQHSIEASDTVDFDEYLHNYYQQYQQLG